MATVHPSRLGLVRNAQVVRPPPPTREEELKMRLMERRNGQNGHGMDTSIRGQKEGRPRGPDERDETRDREEPRPRRSVTPERLRRQRSRSREDRRERDDRPYSPRREERGSRSRDERDDRDGEGRSSARDSPRGNRDARDSPRGHRDSQGGSAPQSRNDSRRASPSYRPYEGGPPPPTLPVTNTSYGYGPGRGDLGMPPPWPGPNGPNGAGGPMRMGFDRPTRGGGGGGGWMNPTELERRRVERDNIELSVWPPSPKEPFRDEDDLEAERKARRKSRKDKRRSKRRSRYSDESSSETDSEEERERRRRRRRREKERRRYDDDSDDEPRRGQRDDSDEDREREQRRRKASVDSEDTDRKRRKTRDRSEEVDASQWVEKGAEPSQAIAKLSPTAQRILPRYEDDDTEVGPQLPVEIKDKIDRRDYAHMLKGEGEAMAAFAASGQRIPRRGEIGLDSGQIEAFEHSGYVMSGSRHQRMNAVRLRKENQVINAEEKRAILKLQREERSKKEGAIIGQFREMLDDRLVHVQNEQRDRGKE